ncbi:MAG: hypothetical protein WBP85_14770, partial [Terracidiphilus sp.]
IAASVDCVRLSGPKEIYVVSWTTRQGDEVASHIRLIGSSGHPPQILQRIEVPDGFGTKVSAEDIVEPYRATLIVLVTNFGVAATQVRVEDYRKERLNEIFRADGDNIELLHLGGVGLQIAVHHHLNAIDIPDLFEMEGGHFKKCNAQYPQYYQRVLEAQHLSRDSAVAPSLAAWLARLLELSGDAEGARLQRERATSVKR